METAEKKSWYMSKTFWFNIIMGILFILELPELADLNIIPMQYITIITAVGNIILRFMTKKEIVT